MINRHLLAKNARENTGGNALILPANRGITGGRLARLCGYICGVSKPQTGLNRERTRKSEGTG